MLIVLVAILIATRLITALGIPKVLTFTSSNTALTLASAQHLLPILIDSSDAEAVHIAVSTFADDVMRVFGARPEVHTDSLPEGTSCAILAATVGSAIMRKVRGKAASQQTGQKPLRAEGDELEGKWEAFDVRVVDQPMQGLGEALVIAGSDRRGVIFGLYTLSEHMGLSPWYWWADVPIRKHDTISFPRDAVVKHGEPTVKYRGFFLNDEQPVLWNWAKNHFGTGDGPPFQAAMYERVFELVLRLRGNYLWPAMSASMFAVDGTDISSGLPPHLTPGPNQLLAERMGVVMGTSHHEPMSRNQKEFNTFGRGEWNFTSNQDFLEGFWRYGVERARGLETVFTVGMRGNGDLPLGGANVPILESVTESQQEILREVYQTSDLHDIPQLWAMYKEVMGYYANGLKCPDDGKTAVTALLADDNWGNLMAVLPEDRTNLAGGGIYYHADYVGDPRDYKWIGTVSLAKMWEQLHIAHTFRTDKIWILNVGDLKMLETPLEYFMNIAYDSERWPRGSLVSYLTEWAEREFALGEKSSEVADIVATHSMYSSRRKAELVDSGTFSIVAFDEAETVLANWAQLESHAAAIHERLDKPHQIAFDELVYTAIKLNANLNRLCVSAAKSNLYATQGRTAANLHADHARTLLEKDWELTEDFHQIEGGKWRHMLSQSHIGYQYWQQPMRNSMPPISYISKHDQCHHHGQIIHTRYTVENSLGAWPGDNKHNCPLGYDCPDPTLLPMDRYGQSRWVEVGAGGTEDVSFTARAEDDWLIVSPRGGHIKRDGSTDTRVTISVDWENIAPPQNGKTEMLLGKVAFTSSDGSTMAATIPILNHVRPDKGFTGAVQGDGYVAIESAHHQSSDPATVEEIQYAWEEIPFYGRTHSGMAIFPVSSQRFEPGKGPSLRYDFWATGDADGDAKRKVDVALQIGPTLNFILGKPLQLAVQMDDQTPIVIQPIPDAPLGSLPADWGEVVSNEIRNLNLPMEVQGEVPGKHSLTLWAMSTGIVAERVILDFGGVSERGNSYLGPPESVIMRPRET